MPRELIVNWVTPAGAGFKSVTYWIEASAVASQRLALHNFCMAVRGQLDNQVQFFQDNSGRELDTATGALTGLWNEPTAYGNVGNGTGDAVADATQALVRWDTNHIVNGRFLRGRTFVPGLVDTAVTDGILSATAKGVFQAAGAALIAAGVQFGVWHRPTSGSGGVMWAAQTAAAQDRLAVLRRRRR